MRSKSIVRTGSAALAACAILLLSSCDEEIVVRQSTIVYPDGAVDRSLRIDGRNKDGTLPHEPDWLERRAGVFVPNPEAWSHIDVSQPGTAVAEGIFPQGIVVPVGLGHIQDDDAFVDGGELIIGVSNLEVLSLWTYEERIEDFFSEETLFEFVDQLTEELSDRLAEELRSLLGDDVATAAADAFLKREAGPLIRDLLLTAKRLPDAGTAKERAVQVSEALARYRVPEVQGLAATADWSETLHLVADPVLEWARQRTAESITRPDFAVSPEDLDFWPTAEALESLEIDDDTADDPLLTHFGRLLFVLEGYYGGLASPAFRFESRVEMPGHLMTSNGATARGGVIWLDRGADLRQGPMVHYAMSIELDDEALRRLGARRAFEPERLLQLIDILAYRDSDGALLALLARAIDEGSLAALRDDTAVPEGMNALTAELLDVLDPESRRWPR